MESMEEIMKKIIIKICVILCAFAFCSASIMPVYATSVIEQKNHDLIMEPRDVSTKYVSKVYTKLGAVITITYMLEYDTMTGKLYNVKINSCTSNMTFPYYSEAKLSYATITGDYSCRVTVVLAKKFGIKEISSTTVIDNIYS